MSTFAVEATLIHPEYRERSVTADFLVDTGAFYSLLPAEVVERLGLETQEDVEGILAPGCSPLLGSVTLGAFALAAHPRHQRLVPARLLGHL